MTEANPLFKKGELNTVNVLGIDFSFYVLSDEEANEMKEQKEKDNKLEKKRRIESLKLNSLMDNQSKESTFENFKLTPSNKKYFNTMKRYAEKFEEIKKENIGLLLMGNPGTGKTMLSFAIANYLLERLNTVIAVSQGSLIQKIKEVSNFGTEEEIKFFNSLKQVDLLILDDLGVEKKTDWQIAKIYEVIDSRYRAQKPIIITTNLDKKTLRDYLNTDGVERIWDRINEMTTTIVFDCEEWRGKRKDNKNAKIQELLLGD